MSVCSRSIICTASASTVRALKPRTPSVVSHSSFSKDGPWEKGKKKICESVGRGQGVHVNVSSSHVIPKVLEVLSEGRLEKGAAHAWQEHHLASLLEHEL